MSLDTFSELEPEGFCKQPSVTWSWDDVCSPSHPRKRIDKTVWKNRCTNRGRLVKKVRIHLFLWWVKKRETSECRCSLL